MTININLVIDQGADFVSIFEVFDSNTNPIDLSIYQAKSQFRKSYSSNSFIDFTTNVQNNEVTLSLTSDQTSNLDSGNYVYDIKLVDQANTVFRLVEGSIVLSPQVTK